MTKAAFEVLAASTQSLPLVFASPHSGRNYPGAFVRASRLDPVTLRRSEDSFVDEIFAAAPEMGAPLIRALFPRAYVDPNREPYELDPAMYDEALPPYVNTRSPRVAAGLGTIARVVANGAEIYGGKLTFSETLQRLKRCYWPYHAALRDVVERTRTRFGFCVLIDCHSMPSVGQPVDRDPGSKRVDFVLGDCHGTACMPEVTETATQVLRGQGYNVRRNTPYSGGFVTRHYGRPDEGLHAMQIEVNRALYMDEEKIERKAGLKRLSRDMRALVAALGDLGLQRIAAQ